MHYGPSTGSGTEDVTVHVLRYIAHEEGRVRGPRLIAAGGTAQVYTLEVTPMPISNEGSIYRSEAVQAASTAPSASGNSAYHVQQSSTHLITVVVLAVAPVARSRTGRAAAGTMLLKGTSRTAYLASVQSTVRTSAEALYPAATVPPAAQAVKSRKHRYSYSHGTDLLLAADSRSADHSADRYPHTSQYRGARVDMAKAHTGPIIVAAAGTVRCAVAVYVLPAGILLTAGAPTETPVWTHPT